MKMTTASVMTSSASATSPKITPVPSPRPYWTLGKYIDGKLNPLWTDIRKYEDVTKTNPHHFRLPKLNYTPTEMRKIIAECGEDIEEKYITHYGLQISVANSSTDFDSGFIGKTIKYDIMNAKKIYYREKDSDDMGCYRTYVLVSHKPLPARVTKYIKQRCFAINPFMTIEFKVEGLETKTARAGKYWKYQLYQPANNLWCEFFNKAKRSGDLKKIQLELHSADYIGNEIKQQQKIKEIRNNYSKFLRKYNFDICDDNCVLKLDIKPKLTAHQFKNLVGVECKVIEGGTPKQPYYDIYTDKWLPEKEMKRINKYFRILYTINFDCVENCVKCDF